MIKFLIYLAVMVGVCFAAPYASYGPRDGSVITPNGVGVVPGSDYRGGYGRPYQNVLPGEPVGFPAGGGGYAPAGYPINAVQGGPYPGEYQGGFDGYHGHGGGYDRRGAYGQQGPDYYVQFPRGHHHGHDYGRDHSHGHNHGHGYEYGRGY